MVELTSWQVQSYARLASMTIRASMIKTLMVTISLTFISCQKKVERNELAEKEAILKLHNLERETRFKKLVDESLAHISDNFISVDKGEITSPTRQELRESRVNYFEAVEFEKWDDLAPPVIRFSEDMTLAYTIVNKEMIITYINKEDEYIRERTEFAWVSIYKKYPEGWKIDCDVTTRKTPTVELLERNENE